MNVRVLTAVLALTLLASGQDAQQPPQGQPTFRTGAELVRIDATVVDNKGLAVTTLTADDFEIEEDGVRQKIQTFKLVRLDGSESHEPWASDDVQPFELARDDIRVFLVFWDEYHIPPNFVAARMRQDLTNFVRTMLGPRDIVAVMDVWTPMSHLRFTRDFYSLLPAISALQGREQIYTPPRNGSEEMHLREGRVELRRAEVAVSALRSAMAHMSTLRPGRTTVLYLGREFQPGRDRTDTFTETVDLIRAASDANVALYSLNPDGLPMQRNRIGFLTDLARNSGGEALMTNDLNVAFQRSTKASSAYYLLGYAPEPMRHDGKFHEVRVRLRKGGLQVRARDGYWAPSATQQMEERKKVEAAAVPSPVEQAFGQFARMDRAESQSEEIATVFVPGKSPETIRIEVPQIWVVRRPADLRAVLGDAPPPAEVGRVFARTERLIMRFGLSGSGAAAASVTVGLVDRKGKRFTDVPVRSESGRWLVDLPLTSFARADFLLSIEVNAGPETTTAYVPIRVAR